MGKRKYDFAGWVTKNDIRCSDGVTIKHDAFKDNDGQQVPLVWNHDYNSPNNVLGHVMLQNQDGGVYGFGFFNDTDDAKSAKKLVQHGDISSMSIGARKLKRNGDNVIHGSIYEVSLVLAGANPGAKIETIMQHSEDNGEEEMSIIHTGTLIHAADDVIDAKPDENKPELQHKDGDDETIGDIINTMTDKQKDAVYALLGTVADAGVEDKEPEVPEKEEVKHKDETPPEEELKQKQIVDEKGDEEVMKQNVFNKDTQDNKDLLKHSINDVLQTAQRTKADSLKDLLAAAEVKNSEGEVLTHGINSIEMLFPEAAQSTNGNTPILYKDPNTAYGRILDGVTKSPFSKVRTLIADLTEEEARAKGYIKGNMKKDEYFSLVKRQTSPTTIYKKQKLDRDDILDITDFNVVAFMNVEMQMMLKEEIARAILVGDGRDFSADDKIDEQNIRPIISDNEFFTIHKNFTDAAAFIEAVIKARSEYRGSGQPDMYIDPSLLADVKLLKGTDGKFLFGDIPSTEAVAARLDVRSIVPTSFMNGKGALIVNLRDYTLGASKGGEITNFDDFDIDFNQHKYLIETRLSGALTMPKSAIHLVQGASAGTGADNTAAGLTYGTRQSDKTTTTTTTV